MAGGRLPSGIEFRLRGFWSVPMDLPVGEQCNIAAQCGNLKTAGGRQQLCEVSESDRQNCGTCMGVQMAMHKIQQWKRIGQCATSYGSLADCWGAYLHYMWESTRWGSICYAREGRAVPLLQFQP